LQFEFEDHHEPLFSVNYNAVNYLVQSGSIFANHSSNQKKVEEIQVDKIFFKFVLKRSPKLITGMKLN
jgi:hypothetical protein